jgi:hypothetical protein
VRCLPGYPEPPRDPGDWSALKDLKNGLVSLLDYVHSPADATGRGPWPVLCCGPYFRMFTARATTRIPTTTEIVSSAIIMSFAHGFIAETSVGLNANEVL